MQIENYTSLKPCFSMREAVSKTALFLFLKAADSCHFELYPLSEDIVANQNTFPRTTEEKEYFS